MERGVTTNRLFAVAAMLASAAGVSCGGLHDGEGEIFTIGTVDQAGGQVLLQEATLDVWKDCLDAPATVTLRRYDRIEHSGAIGPVFEIQIPAPDIFRNDPSIGIATSADVVGDSSSVIGFLIPGSANEQWIPDSPATTLACPPSVVCGPVQSLSFSNPGGAENPLFTTTVLRLAIVRQCEISADCPANQACNSGACQACPTSSPCN